MSVLESENRRYTFAVIRRESQ